MRVKQPRQMKSRQQHEGFSPPSKVEWRYSRMNEKGAFLSLSLSLSNLRLPQPFIDSFGFIRSLP